MTETAALPRAPLDATKHVNFTLGMVLGVDDFDQEFAYLSARDRWLARDLHGYGTTSGLAVSIEVDAQLGPRVNVAPGAAITPCGHLVCVSPAQCANLNEWLAANLEEVRAALAGSSPPGGTLPLFAVLCYAECPTDELPIPGEPCRTEDSLTSPSRVQDDFRLELRLTRPAQREEDAVRDLVHWLRLIPIVQGPGSTTEDLLDALRTAVARASEAPGSPPAALKFDFVWGLPSPALAFGADELAEQLRVLFEVWVTELRPQVRQCVPGCVDCGCGGRASADPSSCGCGPGFGNAGQGGGRGDACDDALLLAEVEVSLVEAEGRLVVADDGWRLDQSERPYLMHTRLLQELLLTGSPVVTADSPPSGAGGPPIDVVTATQVSGPPTATWDPAARKLDLGIPAGTGVDSVIVTPLPPGTPPAVVSFTGGVLTLGLASGRDGAPGPGITAVNATGLPAGNPPTATLTGSTLTLGIPVGAAGPPGPVAGVPVVAAGSFGPMGGIRWTFGDLKAAPVPGASIFYQLTFTAFLTSPGPFVVTGIAITAKDDPPHTIEQLRDEDMIEMGLSPKDGIVIRACAMDLKNQTRGFTLEISDYFKLAV